MKAVFPAGRMYFGRLRDPPHFGSSAAARKLVPAILSHAFVSGARLLCSLSLQWQA